MPLNSITRREFLRLSALTAGGAVLSACALGSAASTSSTSATVAPTALPAASSSVATATIPANGRPRPLTTLGDARRLPTKILGASAESLIEHLIDDPRKVAALKQTAPAFVRFPGGSQSNYYNWRDGLLHFDPKPNSSAYYKFWSAIASKIKTAFPQGVKYEQYAPFAQEIGADVVLVPNLETSSVDEQVAWFKQLASEKILTRYIELGNEFWVAMAGDPNVMRVWQDEKSSMDVMHRYEQALSPLVGPGAKFAVQASAATFNTLPTDSRPFRQRLLQWDRDLAPADWFQAVTAHLYPDPDTIAAQAGTTQPEVLFPLFMARADAGIERALSDIARQLPGKEIWVTEWSPRGGTPPLDPTQVDKATPPMMAHLVARTTLAMLRNPAVTQSLFFTLNLTDASPFQMYVPSGGDYVPMPATVVLAWFDDAANGGSTLQRVVDNTDQPITGLGQFSESYRAVEGGLFRSAKQTVLILQNASPQTRGYDPKQLGQTQNPSRVEMIVASDFANAAHLPAQVLTVNANAPIVLPPYSIVRVVWK